MVGLREAAVEVEDDTAEAAEETAAKSSSTGTDGRAPTYPLVTGGKGHIRVLGAGPWGIHVKHVTDGQWQLFVVHKHATGDAAV